MRDIGYFFWLAWLAGVNPVLSIPAALVLFLIAIAWVVNPREWRFEWTDALSLLTPSVCTVLILVCGTVFERDKILPSEKSQHFLTVLLLLEIAMILRLLWRLQGYRTIALLVGGLQFWYAFLSAIVAGMSMCGRWV